MQKILLEKKTNKTTNPCVVLNQWLVTKKLLLIDYCWVRNAEVDEEKTNKLNSMLLTPKKRKKEKRNFN